MRISQVTVNTINPIIKAMAMSGSLPKSESTTLCKLIEKFAVGTSESIDKPQTTTSSSRMLNTLQVADRLNVCVRTVLRMNKAGDLHGVLLTGNKRSLRFKETEIDVICL